MPPRKLTITQAQLDDAKARLPALGRSYDFPMARFQTEHEDWVVEVEHLEQNGISKLEQLESAANRTGNLLELTIAGETGHGTRKQYRLAMLSNGSYAVQVRVRNANADNYFRRS